MKIAESATRSRYPLSTKKIIKKTITGTLVFVVIMFFLAVFMFSLLLGADSPISVWAILVVIFVLTVFIVLITYFYQRWYFAVYYYELTNDYIIIRKDPITPREITIPYERVQDVYVDQDIFDRIFGIYDVHLSSATISSGMAAHIDGVEKQAADGLRKLLLDTVRSKISKKKNGTTPTN